MYSGISPNITNRLYAELLQEEEENNTSEHSSNELNSTPSLQLQVELQNGSKVYLSPNPQDEPQRLAMLFCKQHNLEPEMVQVLAESIRQSIAYSKVSHQKDEEENVFDSTPSHQEALITQPCTLTCKDRQREREAQTASVSKKSSIASQWNIYEKGKQFEEKHRLWIAKERQVKTKQEEKQCTYQPKINPLSKSIISERSHSQVSQSHSRQKHSKCSIRNQPESRTPTGMSRSVSSNYFIPEGSSDIISQQGRSHQLKQRNISSQSNIFEELYENKRGTKQEKGKIPMPSYKPSINSISRQIVGNTKFTERMIKYEQESRAKKQKRKASEVTNKENLHKPKTGPAPANRNIERLPIGDFLYQKRKKSVIVAKPQPIPSISETSRQIYQKNKEEAFSRLFNHLSGDGQKVSWNLMKFQTIDKDILAIITPLLEELEIMRIELEKDEFMKAISYLFGTLTPAEKHTLMIFGLQKTEKDEPTQRFYLSKKSRDIVEHSKRGNMDITQFCSWREQIRDCELERRRLAKERAEMEQCTFQPKVLRKVTYF